jgi:hypothetical protein
MLRWTLMLTAALACAACDESDSTTETPAEMPPAEMPTEMDAQPLCVEDDFGGTGWLGPAVQDGVLTLDPATTYRVSTTVLYLQDGDTPFQTFNQKIGPILGEMATMDGLLAWHLGSSEKCGAQRTITVWRDIDAMYRFVGSPAHVDAMGITSDVARDARVTSWDSVGADVALEWADYRPRLMDAESY